jgi:hypothetical protein
MCVCILVCAVHMCVSMYVCSLMRTHKFCVVFTGCLTFQVVAVIPARCDKGTHGKNGKNEKESMCESLCRFTNN